MSFGSVPRCQAAQPGLLVGALRGYLKSEEEVSGAALSLPPCTLLPGSPDAFSRCQFIT